MDSPQFPLEKGQAARVEFLRMIIQRLERLSADSRWARIASGYRRSMYKLLERMESGQANSSQDEHQFDLVVQKGLELLAHAARELGDPDLLIHPPGSQ